MPAGAAAPAAQPRADPGRAGATPGLPQVACFDTAFHRTMPEVAQAYALPSRSWRKGIRRYGFHGLSYEYIASVLPQVAPAIAGWAGGRRPSRQRRLALRAAGRAQHGHDDGLLGARRPADGHALRPARPGGGAASADAEGMDRRARWRTCSTADPACWACPASRRTSATCWRATSRAPRFAIEVFVHRVARGIGSLAGGARRAGRLRLHRRRRRERGPDPRQASAERLRLAGRRARCTAPTRRRPPASSTAGSRVAAHVVPTDENLMIARHTPRTGALRRTAWHAKQH